MRVAFPSTFADDHSLVIQRLDMMKKNCSDMKLEDLEYKCEESREASNAVDWAQRDHAARADRRAMSPVEDTNGVSVDIAGSLVKPPSDELRDHRKLPECMCMKPRHNNDVLVEIESCTIDKRSIMSRPGTRCPSTLPVPIETVGRDCIGRVVLTSNAAIHGVGLDDRVAAIHPFYYCDDNAVENDKHQHAPKYALVDSGFVVSIPGHVDAAQAVTLIHLYMTAFQSIQQGLHRYDTTATHSRYDTTQLACQSILIQNGHTELGLAIIEMASVLGAFQISATGPLNHHQLISEAGALVLDTESLGARPDMEKFGMIFLQDVPNLDVFEKFMHVRQNHNGILVKINDASKEGDRYDFTKVKRSEGVSCDDLIEFVEKAKLAYEDSKLKLRLTSCAQCVTYDGACLTSNRDQSLWKKDLRFLITLLGEGKLKPRISELIRLEDIAKTQDRIELNGSGGTIVCLPWRRMFAVTPTDFLSALSVRENCSLWSEIESKAVTVIASIWRRCSCLSAYKRMVEAKRSYDEMTRLRRECCAKQIQRTWNISFLKRRVNQSLINIQYIKKNEMKASTTIERVWRKFSLYRKDCARTIQSRWRCHVVLKGFTRYIARVVLLQTFIRSRLARLYYTCTLNDIIISQSVARKWLAEGRVAKLRYNAATTIQSTWRTFVVKKCFTETKKRVVLVQSHGRRLIAWKCLDRLKTERDIMRTKAATIIVSAWRRFACTASYKRTVRDVTFCQSLIRRKLAAAKLTKLRAGAIMIQSRWRVCVARRQYINSRSSIVVLQSFVRGSIASTKYRKSLIDVMICQGVVRCWSATRKVEMLRSRLHIIMLKRQEHGALIIQRKWRAFNERTSFLRIVSCVIHLQSLARKMMVTRRIVAVRRGASIALQSAPRISSIGRKHYKFASAVSIIQSNFRRKNAENSLMDSVLVKQCDSAENISIECLHRDMLTTCTDQPNKRTIQEIRNLSDVINQDGSYMVSKDRHASSTKIQTLFRRHVTKKNYLIAMAKIIVLETKMRQVIARMLTQQIREHNASLLVEVHNVERVDDSYMVFKKRLSASHKIPATLRAFIAMKNYRMMRRNIILCQSVVRRELAKKGVQELRDHYNSLLELVKSAESIALKMNRISPSSPVVIEMIREQ